MISELKTLWTGSCLVTTYCVFTMCTCSLQERQKDFFAAAANMSSTEREEKYNAIRKDYLKVVEDSQEKIQIAEDSYALVSSRFNRKTGRPGGT